MCAGVRVSGIVVMGASSRRDSQLNSNSAGRAPEFDARRGALRETRPRPLGDGRCASIVEVSLECVAPNLRGRISEHSLPRPRAQPRGPWCVAARVVVGSGVEAEEAVDIADIERVLREDVEHTKTLPPIVAGLQAEIEGAVIRGALLLRTVHGSLDSVQRRRSHPSVAHARERREPVRKDPEMSELMVRDLVRHDECGAVVVGAALEQSARDVDVSTGGR